MKKIILSLLLAGSVLSAPSFTTAKPAAKSAALTPVTAEALKKQIAARKGKVVLVNFWATWCAPCVAELPDLIRWKKQYAAKGLEIMLVSADIPSAAASARKLLASKGHTGPGWIVGEDQFKFIGKFDPTIKDAFALPRSYIYNRQGKLVKIVAQTETGALEKALQTALKK